LSTVPVHKFYSDSAWIEGSAIAQLDTLAQATPDVLALSAMPDLHPGKYGPVGCGMLASEIHPPIIGSDIGCGMGLYRIDEKHRKLRTDKIASRMKVLDRPWDGNIMAALQEAELGPSLYDMGLGTIGGGNHFCEVQAVQEILDEDEARNNGIDPDMTFVLVHTGSRALGFSVLDSLLHDSVSTLAVDSERGQKYLADHDHAVKWAALNRKVIAERAGDAIRGDVALVADLSHNFLECLPQGILHRKGAAPANRGLVPIPGSRETLSYLVKPLDTASPDALACLAHGAGRKYDRGSMHGRIQNVKSVRETMTKNPYGGIIVCEDRSLLIEEAGAAYKNIDRVIADLVEFGLVQVVATFRPLITFKTGQSTIGAKGREENRK
jgi:release factor H-coupled RctB family protein